MNGSSTESLLVRALREEDLSEADRIFREAFGTFIGLPDPTQFTGDALVVYSRFHAFPEAAFGAFLGDRLVGSLFATRWGSFAFLGPLSVDPALWRQRIAQRLMSPVMECFRAWGVTQTGLYTFPDSPRHLALYHKYGFRPRFLTAVMGKPLGRDAPSAVGPQAWSGINEGARALLLEGCRQVADGIYPGLDLTEEIQHLTRHRYGELIWTGDFREPDAFALCHRGPGSEAGSGACYVKFAAVRSGPEAPASFHALLGSLEAYASSQGAGVLLAGVNTGRVRAYEAMLREGYRIQMTGVALLGAEGADFCHSKAWVLDDWR